MKGTFYLHSKVTYYRECVTCHVILSPEYFNTVTKYLNITIFTWTISKFCYAGKYHFSDYLISFLPLLPWLPYQIKFHRVNQRALIGEFVFCSCTWSAFLLYICIYIYGLYKVLRLFWLCILCILEPHTANGHFISLVWDHWIWQCTLQWAAACSHLSI